MKRVETLSGKNLPRLAVAKPGWPSPLMSDDERKAFMDGTQERHRGYVEKALTDPAIRAALHHEPLVSDKAVHDFTRVCDQNDHWHGCLESIMTRADELWDAVKAGKLNESAVDGLLRSHLDQPAFYPEWKDDLHRRAMERGGVFDQTGLSEKLRKD